MYTWPVGLPILMLQLDHCLHTDGVMAAGLEVLPAIGSDHYPPGGDRTQDEGLKAAHRRQSLIWLVVAVPLVLIERYHAHDRQRLVRGHANHGHPLALGQLLFDSGSHSCELLFGNG